MQQAEIPVPIVKFGVFEVDLRAGELTRLGKRVRLQEQPFQLLAMLLAKPGVLVTREELHLKLWPQTTVDFDHGLNKAVSKIREALGDSAENPRFIETVARRGYKFLADVTVVEDEQPAPETVDLAPRQKHGPPDLRVATGLPAATSPERSNGFLAQWVFGGLLVLAVLLVTVIHPSKLPSPQIRSIAVLPLQHLSSDMSLDYFTSGMTDELITDLAQIRRLRVIASPSSIVSGRPHQSLREIARDLNVDAVMTGSVLFSSNRVRVTARLVRMPSERDVWAQSYERDLQHPLKTQSEIAQSIADELRKILDRQEDDALRKPAGSNTVDYGSYLKGRYLWNWTTGDGLKDILRHFTDVIAFDPNYADACTGLADAYALSGNRKYGMLPPAGTFPEAKAVGIRALALAGSFGEVHTLLAYLLEFYDKGWDLAEAEHQQPIKLKPVYAMPRLEYAWHLTVAGKADEGITESRKAETLSRSPASSSA